MSNSLENFAKELKAKREAKNISINDIYGKTRIDAKYLSKIEEGDFSFIDDVYIRAFIRKYAEAVDFQPDEAIKMYNAALLGKSVDEVSESNNEDNHEAKDGVEKKSTESLSYSELTEKKNNPLLLLGLFVVVVLMGALYYLFVQKGSEEIIIEPKIGEILKEQKATDDTPKFEVKKEKVVIPEKVVEVDSLLLKINASDTVWFRITIDNRINDEFILNPSHSKTLMAESKINLLLGNAGGVELILNGEKLNFSGKKGEIRNISVDADGIHCSNIPTDKNE